MDPAAMKIAYPKVTKLLKASKIRIEKEKQLGSSRSTIKTKLQIFEKHDLPQLRTTTATTTREIRLYL